MLNGSNGTNSNIDFACQCQECFKGDRCQLKDNIIPLSLTSAVLADIRITDKQSERTAKKAVFVFIVSLIVLVSIISNMLSLQVFLLRDVRDKTRPSIRGDNILFLILYSVSSLIVSLELQSRVILMLFDQYSSAGYTFYSCNIAPVVGTMLVHLGLWLSAGITLERLLFDVFNIEVMNTRAQIRTVIIMIIMTVTVFSTHIHEIFGRQALPDPVQPNTFVCTFDYDKKWLNTLDDSLSTLHLALPCFIHFVCFIITLWRLGHEQGSSSYCKLSLDGLKDKRLYLIPPILIIVCCLPHFIFAHLMYHCIESSQRSFLHLHIALNLFIFIPQAVTFLIYILPSTDYINFMWQTAGGRLMMYLFCRKQKFEAQERKYIESDDTSVKHCEQAVNINSELFTIESFIT
ncbi:unnamed protein product [Rotaria sp. Silwood2]|nr:unnamed protein product [Rotaria sp. Silwood2]